MPPHVRSRICPAGVRDIEVPHDCAHGILVALWARPLAKGVNMCQCKLVSCGFYGRWMPMVNDREWQDHCNILIHIVTMSLSSQFPPLGVQQDEDRDKKVDWYELNDWRWHQALQSAAVHSRGIEPHWARQDSKYNSRAFFVGSLTMCIV